MTTVKVNNEDDEERKRAIFDVRQVAQMKMTNFAEKGFLQKHIDILYKLGYYRDNKTIFAGSN